MNFYKHHIGDYDADTSHLTWLEDMAYTRLMRLYYRREQPIPTDVAQACRLVRATSKVEREAVAAVLAEFFVRAPDGWHNKRCDEEIGHAEAKAKANRENGGKGGRPKSNGTQEKPTGLAVGSSSLTQNNLSQTPDSRLQTKAKALPPPDGFGEFWRVYPRKVDKADAEKAWRKLGHVNGLLPTILNAVKAQTVEGGTLGTEPRFIPHAASWLNARRWEDEAGATAAKPWELP